MRKKQFLKQKIPALVLSAVMIFASIDTSIVQAEEIEYHGEETTAALEDELQITKTEDISMTSPEASDSATTSEMTEQTSFETELSEKTMETESEVSQDSGTEYVQETEQEVIQETLLDFNEEDCIAYNMEGNVKWAIFKSGKLIIEGVVNGSDYVDEETEWKKYTEDMASKVTSAVVNLSGYLGDMPRNMFSQYHNLESVDLSGFDTSKATDLSFMFSGCTKLTSVDMSGLDVSNVTNMSGMFNGCTSLTSVNMSGLNASKVRNMGGMFNGCSSLTSLDISGFNTSDVVDMGQMFRGCSSLTSLDISGLNTSNVTSMIRMFSGCTNLVRLNVGSLDVSSVTSFVEMFEYCSSLTDLDLSGINTSQEVDTEGMFRDCSSLTSLDLSCIDIHLGNGMLDGCTSLSFIYPPRSGSKVNLPVSSPEDKWYISYGMEIKVLYPASDKNEYYYRSDYTGEKIDSEKSKILISGISIHTNKVYDGISTVPYSGTPIVVDIHGNPMSGITVSDGIYTGTLVDGAIYEESTQAPAQAGNYELTFSVAGENADRYVLQKNSYHFSISPKTVTITAPEISIIEGEERPDLSELTCEINGLLEGDTLIKEPLLKYDEDNVFPYVFGGESYRIIPYGAEATENYSIQYKIGKLTIEDPGYPKDDPDDEIIIYKGTTGSNITWKIAQSGKLTIEGTSTGNDTISREWCEHPKRIKSAVVKVSGLTSTASMFYGCNYLERIDLSGLDTSNVTNMSYMFYGCAALRSIDASGFNTSNVTKMSYMFAGCRRLKRVDLSSFDTSKVKSMASMFFGCENLEQLDVSGFDTGSVTDMDSMFNDCCMLKSLDVSGFNTSNATDMDSMFKDCNTLKSLDVSSFNTSNVTGMYEMFWNCRSLTQLNVSNFDTSNVSNMIRMFSKCTSLKHLDISGFNISNVKNMEGLFSYCSSLTELDVRSLDTSQIKSLNHLFNGCTSLTDLDISGFDTGNATSMYHMFSDCSKLISIDISGFDMSKVVDMEAMFSGCSSLISLDLSHLDMTGRRINMDSFLSGCTSLSCLATPVNSNEMELPVKNSTDVWYYKDSKTTTKYIPGGLDHSVVLCKNDYPGTEIDLTKQTILVSGLTVNKNKTYDGTPNSYEGTPVLVDSEGNPVSGITLSDGVYTGTLADGSNYAETIQAPIQAGNYILSYTVTGENAEQYNLKRNTYSFTIRQKAVTITAPTLSIEINGQLPKLDELNCGVDGLLENDELLVKPLLKYSVENIATLEVGRYRIIPYGAQAGNNYRIQYVNGTLTVGNPSSKPSQEPDDDDPAGDDSSKIDLSLDAKGAIATIKAKTYDGMEYEPELKVTVIENKKKKTLTEGADYKVVYENNINAGTGKVIVKGRGMYKGELTGTFTIKPKPIGKLKFVVGSISAGDAVSDASIYIYDDNRLLRKGTDYTLSTTQSSKKVSVTVTGIDGGNYTGSKKITVAVYEAVGDQSKIIAPANVTLAYTETDYTGKAVKDNEPVVKIGDTTLVKDKDYKVQYQNNKNAGTAFVIITGKGEYKGKAIVSFQIKPLSLEEGGQKADIVPIKDKTYNGKLQKPTVKVKAGNKTLKKNKDYTVRYTANLHSGTATVTITGKGNYAGTAEQKFTINKQDIKKVSVKGTKDSGLILLYGSRALKEDVDYTLTYGESIKNKVTVTINATSNSDFTGSVTKTVKEK